MHYPLLLKNSINHYVYRYYKTCSGLSLFCGTHHRNIQICCQMHYSCNTLSSGLSHLKMVSSKKITTTILSLLSSTGKCSFTLLLLWEVLPAPLFNEGRSQGPGERDLAGTFGHRLLKASLQQLRDKWTESGSPGQ